MDSKSLFYNFQYEINTKQPEIFIQPNQKPSIIDFRNITEFDYDSKTKTQNIGGIQLPDITKININLSNIYDQSFPYIIHTRNNMMMEPVFNFSPEPNAPPPPSTVQTNRGIFNEPQGDIQIFKNVIIEAKKQFIKQKMKLEELEKIKNELSHELQKCMGNI